LHEKFDLLEATLHSLCGHYYAGHDEIRKVVDEANCLSTEPDSAVVENAIAAMATPQSHRYFFKNMKNPNWVKPLREKKCFKNPPNAEKSEGNISYRDWPQGEYLVAIAGERPKDVLEIITDVCTDNFRVMGVCSRALAEMPVDVAVQATNLIRRMLNKEIYWDWYNVGESAAQLMIKFADGEKWDGAFGIAEKLLAVKTKEGKSSNGWYDLNGGFDDYHYGEAILKYFKAVWERDKQGLPAGKLLVGLLDGQIERDQLRNDKESVPERVEKKFKEILGGSEERQFDITEHSYITMPQICAVEKEHPDVADILVGGIRIVGEYLMEHAPDDAEEYIDYLHQKNRSLYDRIAIHLHRHAPDNMKWNQKIREIIQDVENVKDCNTANEYRNLLHDRYELLTDAEREPFFSWVETQVEINDEAEFQKWYEEKHGRTANEDDIEKYQHYLRAKELYCIRDKEPRFQEYLEKSEKSDGAVKPWTSSTVGYSPSAKKYSPLTQEEMKVKAPEEVIKYILEYDSSHDNKEEFSEDDGLPVNRKESLASAFKDDLKERMAGYLEVDVSIISRLSRSFIRNFLYTICEEVQNKRIEEQDWDTVVNLCKVVYEARVSVEDYREPMKAIIHIFEHALRGDVFQEKAKAEHVATIWELLVALLDYRFEMDDDESSERDPFQKCANRVRGTAFENIIRFGLSCKNHKPKLFEKLYATELRDRLQYVLSDIDRPEVLCVFGVFFVNLCWIDEQWVQENISHIFPDNEPKRWDATWGSYIRWGRPSKKSFLVLEEKYAYAIEMIEGKLTYEGEESYTKRLTEHIMLAYWQGWTGLDEKGIVRKILGKMDDQLRAGASHWLSTGFKHLKDHKDDDWCRSVVQRMREYWDWRSADMEEDPSAHRKEAREFAGWVKDTPFNEDETLLIVEKAVDLGGGVAARMRDVNDFLEGVGAIAEGQELRVLLLIQKAIEDPEVERWSWQYEKVKEQLTKLMDRLIVLQDDYVEVANIRQAAIKVADSLGRLGLDYLKPHYDKLAGQI